MYQSYCIFMQFNVLLYFLIARGYTMNPLDSIKGTIISGVVLALIVLLAVASNYSVLSIMVWLHVIFGITWIGLLYYFNFIQVPAMALALADKDGPGPAAIGKYIAPNALLWFRWSALATWVMGAGLLGANFTNAFMLQNGFVIIGIGAWLGTIMLFNVWGLIWPNQKKVLGIKEATDEEKAKAKRIASLASRTNVMLSIPMLLCMVGYKSGIGF